MLTHPILTGQSPLMFSTMAEFSHELHSFVSSATSISISVLELLSIGIILYTTAVSLIQLFYQGSIYARVYLLHGQSVGLTFKLGAEILKTVIASNMDEIWQIVMLVIIKAMMILLIDWELNGTKEHKSSKEIAAVAEAEADAETKPLQTGFQKFVHRKQKKGRVPSASEAALNDDQVQQLQQEISDLKELISKSNSESNPQNNSSAS